MEFCNNISCLFPLCRHSRLHLSRPSTGIPNASVFTTFIHVLHNSCMSLSSKLINKKYESTHEWLMKLIGWLLSVLRIRREQRREPSERSRQHRESRGYLSDRDDGWRTWPERNRVVTARLKTLNNSDK